MREALVEGRHAGEFANEMQAYFFGEIHAEDPDERAISEQFVFDQSILDRKLHGSILPLGVIIDVFDILV